MPNTEEIEDVLLLSETPSAVQYSAKDIADQTGQSFIKSEILDIAWMA